MWDKIKEYLTIVFAGGLWYGEKGMELVEDTPKNGNGKGTEWDEEDKTALLIVLGIIAFIVILYFIGSGVKGR